MSEHRERRRVIVAAPHIVEIRTEESKEPASDEALVRLLVSGVCGSDNSAIAGHHPSVPLPYYPGHEVVGLVQAVGADVYAVQPGQRVTVNPPLPCEECKMCLTDRSNLCEHLEFFGCGWNEGGMADSFVVRADRLYLVPEELSDEQAALIEPLATPVHAARIAGDLSGKSVVIEGAGTIGLLMLAAARAAGARTIVMTDVLESKLQNALELGADATVSALTEDLAAAVRQKLGESADFVFDCVSNQRTITAAIQMAMKGGTVVVVGVPHGPLSIPLDIVQDQQIRVQGTATYLPEDYDDAVSILRSGRVKPEDFITATFPLSRAAEAFAAASSGMHTKVLVTADV